jgi:thiosulfate/3-mercaptopyruvate sulfurtransferase
MKNINNNFLVDTQWLSDHLQDDNIAIVDCQWDEIAYLKAHIPNAIMRPGHPYLKTEQNGNLGKNMLSSEEFSRMMTEAGIDSDTEVICYDQLDNHLATRLWWLLKYYGHKKVRLLNGGWQAWVTSGLPVSCTATEVNAADRPYCVHDNPDMNITMEELLENYDNRDIQILDVRRESEYRDTETRNNKRGGHIPGAIHLEWKQLLSQSKQWDGVNFFRLEKEMQALLDQNGVGKDKTTVVYCQAGVRASFTFFCLKMLGYPEVKLYDGSMGEWANADQTPLAT